MSCSSSPTERLMAALAGLGADPKDSVEDEFFLLKILPPALYYIAIRTFLASTILLGGNVELVGVDDVGDDDALMGFGNAVLVCLMNQVGDIHGLEVYAVANGVLGGADDALQAPSPQW